MDFSRKNLSVFPRPVVVTGSNNIVNAESGAELTLNQHALISVFCALVQKHGRDASASDASALTDQLMPHLLS